MVLDRDDRGGLNNTIVVNGKKISSPIRQETVSIRGIVAGEYTINVNHYLATTGAPVPVAVKVEKVNPAVEVVHYDTVTLDHTGQETNGGAFQARRQRQCGRREPSRKVADPIDPQRSPHGEMTPRRRRR